MQSALWHMIYFHPRGARSYSTRLICLKIFLRRSKFSKMSNIMNEEQIKETKIHTYHFGLMIELSFNNHLSSMQLFTFNEIIYIQSKSLRFIHRVSMLKQALESNLFFQTISSCDLKPNTMFLFVNNEFYISEGRWYQPELIFIETPQN